jgi:L-2-hydroxyglutarate oxidase
MKGVDPRIVVVGGGIVGLATAYRLQQRIPRARIIVLEKESAVGRHQSGHNSGVLHCGLYYRPGSRRARMAVRGIRQMTEFCRTHGIAHEICGKTVVAANAGELPRLHALLEYGARNGLNGIRLLNRDELREIEPHAGGVAAIAVPEEGIADYPGVCRTLELEIRRQGGAVVTGARVTALVREQGGWRAVHTGGETEGAFVVSCAGLHSDRVAALTGQAPKARIVPFRGEYYFIRPERQFLVRNLIYPVPDPALPFLGVHFTRRITGGIEAGPNAVLALAREGYTKFDLSPRDMASAFLYPGLWHFLRKFGHTCWDEALRSFSRRRFCESLQQLVPEIREEDLIPGGAGVRAQAMGPDGTLIDDFHFVEGDRELHVVNAPSPGATASLAIGEEIAETVAQRLNRS